jgi:hypothetical protein
MPRIFTLDEANALLPRLRDLLPEMQDAKGEVERLRAEIAELTRPASGNGHLLGRAIERKRRDAQKAVDRLNELSAEVDGLGCEIKGVDEGLVDFRAERDGRVVYLCWRLGEEDITHWHELDTGFAGRQPL